MVDKYEALERLSKLRADGVLSDDEFVAEKARLLAGDDRAVSANSTFPSEVASGGAKRRALWIVPLALIAVAILIGINIGRGAVGTSNTGSGTSAAVDTRLPVCHSKSVRQMLTDGIEHSVAEKIATLRVLDLTNLTERSYDADKPERICAGDVTLNTGDEHIGFRLYLSSDGTVLFRTMDDPGPSAPAATINPPAADQGDLTGPAPMKTITSQADDSWLVGRWYVRDMGVGDCDAAESELGYVRYKADHSYIFGEASGSWRLASGVLQSVGYSEGESFSQTQTISRQGLNSFTAADSDASIAFDRCPTADGAAS